MLIKKAGGCSCYKDGYLQALREFMWEVDKKLDCKVEGK
jgi:hypothetical protein